MQTKICEQCNKEFVSSKKWRFCCIECSNNRKRKIPNKICPTCWKSFRPIHSTNKYCCRECAFESRRTLKEIICPICWGEFKQKYSWQKYCSRNCVTEFNKTLEHTKIIKKKANERYQQTWIMWPCQLPHVRNSWKDISKINKKYKELLEWWWYNTIMEFPLWNYSYDIKIDKTLIEINPAPTHNSTRGPAFEWTSQPKPKRYHYNKARNAIKKWYKCINVRDRTEDAELLQLIQTNFIYYWPPNLHWYNIKTKEHLLDKWYNEKEMLDSGFVKIYDSWTILFK